LTQYIGIETDEMYTDYNDIVNELDHYPDYLFINKKILFPCDWDAIYNCGDLIEFETQNKINRINNIVVDSSIPKCNFVKYFWDTYGKFKENNVELFTSGYNPSQNNPNNLSCMDIDYSKFDWVITNPPFSFVSEFLKKLAEEADRRKNTSRPFHFIIMIPWQTLGSSLSNLIIEKKVFPGWGKHINLTFHDINMKPILDKSGKARKVAIYWVTDLDMNFPTVDRNYFVPQHQFKELIHTYFDKRLYRDDAPVDIDGNPCASDGYPIVVHNKTMNMYYDYPGYQAVPITSIDYYNPRIFEIFASTQITTPCKELGNFKIIPASFGLQNKMEDIKKITSFIIKIRPEVLELTKNKKPSEVFDVCKDILGIKEVKIDE
jgi:hypothetical protein